MIPRSSAIPSRADRDKALVGLMLLPTIFLPMNASLQRIERHLASGRAFDLTIERQVTRAHFDSRDRTSKMVEQLAKDHKIKAAVKVMQNNAEATQQPTFRERVDLLRSKFPIREHPVPTDPIQAVAPFTKSQLMVVLDKMSRSAASCIDGWSRDLLKTAIYADSTIADDLGIILAWIAYSHGTGNDAENARCPFGKFAMDIIRMGRLVGIPKPEGGVRPIVISAFFLKLAGALILERSHVKLSRYQYAIHQQRGAERVVHLAREAYDKGLVLIRLDSANAFNVARRDFVYKVLHDMNVDIEVRRYFATMYEPVSSLAVYGEAGQIEFVESSEGVRQGDAMSSLFFCLLMDLVCRDVADKFPTVDIWCYMDDCTIAAPPEIAMQVLQIATEALTQHGFKPNLEKSAVICKSDLDIPSIVRRAKSDETFKILGANMTGARH